VPDLAPFRGLRYTAGPDLTAVTAPPYDVIDAQERASLLASHPDNAVRLILPEGPGDEAYDTARATLAAWRAAGILSVDPDPALYAYRMDEPRSEGATHRTIGVIGALALPNRDADDILPHERTLPKAKSDRLALLRATKANFDPIWGLTLASGLAALVDAVPPLARSVDAEGVVHEVGRIDDPTQVAAVRALVASEPMVLADGHHRFETACTYRAETDGPGADAILALVVSLDDVRLDVRPFHRLVRGAPADLRGRLAELWSVHPAGAATPETIARLVADMERADALGLVDAEGAALLVPTPGLPPVLGGLPEPLRDVDAARFDVAVKPFLGGATLAYRSDAASVARVVLAGEADSAVLLRGVHVEEIRDAAHARVLMPEKTTYFAPKPRTGMVMRTLDGS
jgi:uncharacterized protein (DUF1015 family)